jgi:hypothetical protein
MPSPDLPNSGVNPNRDSSPVKYQEEKKDASDIGTVSSTKVIRDNFQEIPNRKFDHNVLLAEYDDDYQKDASFEAGWVVVFLLLTSPYLEWCYAYMVLFLHQVPQDQSWPTVYLQFTFPILV